ncbi:piggyBac transposable element-derived protein 4-like [Centruroides vittatus]|uniref:piggyBac transposable element-derived protein 4-like n=1 Tax=Centruroides vittatus TaxID=120091 RepID=UPI00350FE8BE
MYGDFMIDSEIENIVYEDASSEEECDFVEVRSENTDTEQEENEDISEVGSPAVASSSQVAASSSQTGEHCSFLARDGTRWSMWEYPATKTRRENLIYLIPGPIGEATNARSIFECWNLFVTDDILDIIVIHTNQQIQKVQPHYERERDANTTDLQEIKALIGLFYLAAYKKVNRCHVNEMWTTDGTGFEIARTAMSERRFRFLLANLRFDDKQTRGERLKFDKLAAVRTFLDVFTNNCIKNYNVSEYCTVDEKLEGFRGRCGFRQYIPSKPNKYGIKIFLLVDSKTFYTHNLEVYCGKQPDGPFSVSNSADSVVKRLTRPIVNSGRNITTDNWFTSFSLATDLLQDRLTLVGTIRKNRKEIPAEFLNIKNRKVNSSKFAFTKAITLVSYVPKKSKNVLLLSSLHHSEEIDRETGLAKKPEIISFYNRTKGGVDTVDQLTGNYNCVRNTSRWPMIIFYCVLNLAGINSYIIHQANKNTSKLNNRREFLKELCIILMSEHIDKRKCILNLSKTIRTAAERIFPSDSEAGPSHSSTECVEKKRKRCDECETRKDRKTKYTCVKCKKYLCLEHAVQICRDCVE